jgi:hypothetical protein
MSLRVALVSYVLVAVIYSSYAALQYAASASNLCLPVALRMNLPVATLENFPLNVIGTSVAYVVDSVFNPVSKSTNSRLPASHTNHISLSKHAIDAVRWTSAVSGTPNVSNYIDLISMPASLFLSKAFQVSHEHLAYANEVNLDVIPFLYRATLEHDSDDVTITTLVTRNRFQVLKQLVERYHGPVSVTIHVSRKELLDGQHAGDAKKGFLKALHHLYSSSSLMTRFLDIHLVVTASPIDRQFNTWRNIARLFARTDYVMMLDVDFVPCTDFRGRLRGIRGEVKTMLEIGTAALVIPAFEFTEPSDGLNATSFPSTKQALVELYNASRVAMFHATWAPGHSSTDYERFLFHSPPGAVYKINQDNYQHSYEPYIIFRRDGNSDHPATLPWCDERFIGYGGNKAACLYEMYLSGINFYVLSDDFLIHQSHEYDEKARKLERRYNRRIYADFREEVCLKYLTLFRDSGNLQSPKAKNAIEACKKVKGVSRLASMARSLFSLLPILTLISFVSSSKSRDRRKRLAHK